VHASGASEPAVRRQPQTGKNISSHPQLLLPVQHAANDGIPQLGQLLALHLPLPPVPPVPPVVDVQADPLFV
jgi:hypothetical protein